MTLSETPHKKTELDGKTYYISRYPEGDTHIHESKPYDKDGYGGRTIKFLLEDGSIEKVKGPYCCDGLFDFGVAKKLANHLEDSSISAIATRLIVGKDLFLGEWGGRKRVVLFEEPQFILGDYRNRLDPLWIDLEIQVCVRGGAAYKSIKYHSYCDYLYLWQ